MNVPRRACSLQPHPALRRRTQSGFTVIEVIVVIAVIGILSSLILPAVMRARESSRRTQCLSNIRQVGIALQAFESTYRHYPHPYGKGFMRDYSPLAQLLPHLEEDAVYNTINFSPVDREKDFIDWSVRDAEAARFGRVRINVFLCPSDPYSRGTEFGGTNYRGNAGGHATWGCKPTDPGPPDPIGGDGFFYGVRAKKPMGGRGGDMRDGLSQTVAFAERLVGTSTRAPYPEGNYFITGPLETGEACWSRENWVRRCRALTRDHGQVNRSMGHSWLYASYDHTYYNHILLPNSPTPDCGETYRGVVTARSWHRGGVNVAMGDGQARFVNERIDLDAWRALGTRASGDVVDATVF